MDIDQKLTDEYKGRKYRRGDDKVIVISHVLRQENPQYVEAIFDVLDPEEGTSGQGSCALDILARMREIT